MPGVIRRQATSTRLSGNDWPPLPDWRTVKTDDPEKEKIKIERITFETIQRDTRITAGTCDSHVLVVC